MRIKVKKAHPNAVMPQYQTSGAACFDLHVIEGCIIPARSRSPMLSTGLQIEVPDGYVMKVYIRGGHGINAGLQLSNSVGIVDADYTGITMIRLQNDTDDIYHVKNGERVAQAEIVPCWQCEFVEVDEIKTTVRGDGAFNSTGKQ